MSTIQIRFETGDQLEKLLDFLRQMKLDFNVLPDDTFSAVFLADTDPSDAYKASHLALAADWDSPENDHWDSL